MAEFINYKIFCFFLSNVFYLITEDFTVLTTRKQLNT